jgi:gluconokinase
LSSPGPYVVALDVGTSSVRTLLFDASGQEQPSFGHHLAYQITATHDGGVEVDPEMLLKLCVDCISKIHEQLQAAALRPMAVAFDCFWHSFLGITAAGVPTTSILHLFDTRSAPEVQELSRKLDLSQVHARTGCTLHTSYWPGKLIWLSKARPQAFGSTRRWVSFGEYLYLKILGEPVESTSMASGTGLWNQFENDYDSYVLDALPVSRDQLSPASDMDRVLTRLIEPYRSLWPLLDGISWFPVVGDGACNNIGSGCATRNEFSLMVGTSGAMRCVIESDKVQIPPGLWCYRVDRRRFVLGGALSNGGDVYAWMSRTLALPPPAETEQQLASTKPGTHNLLLLPFFAGERSPYWRSDLRAAITGLDLATRPIDILQAALESVSLRFSEIFKLMIESLGTPKKVMASGGALLASSAWTQMMADALAFEITSCLEHEATSRGAALLAFERLGVISDISALPTKTGAVHKPDVSNTAAYRDLESKQTMLFKKLFIEQ